MSRNGSGTYNLPSGNPVVTGTTITSTWANTTLSDIGNALTGSVAADGQTPMSGSLNMGNNQITNAADPTTAQSVATKAYVDSAGGLALLKASNLSDVADATVSRTNLSAAKSGANSDITSLTGLTTPLSVAQGGTGAATLAGANIPVTTAASTFTALQTFSGSATAAALLATNIKEVATIAATAATGTINYSLTSQSVLYFTTSASGNWTLNFRASSLATLDSIMAVGETMAATFMVTNGSTAYYNSAVTIDGNAITPKWQNQVNPSAGNPNGIDVYTYAIIKTASATFTVLATINKF